MGLHKCYGRIRNTEDGDGNNSAFNVAKFKFHCLAGDPKNRY